MNFPAPNEAQIVSNEQELGRVVEQLTARLHAGEQVDLQSFILEHPLLADKLGELLPALQMLAELGRSAPAAIAANTPPEAGDELVGTLGDYRLLREVGRGGMGVVYEAEQISLNRRVALKVLPFAATLDARHLQRFKNEANAAAHLHHQNIVPVYQIGCERAVHFYAMQFIEGQTLSAMIDDLRQMAALDKPDAISPAPTSLESTKELQPGNANGAASQETCFEVDPFLTKAPGSSTTLAIAKQTTEQRSRSSSDDSTQTPAFFRTMARLGVQATAALEHAHTMGIIHRDIKPGNMIIDLHGDLWITDFGLAQIQGDVKLTMTGDLIGTIRYMSPEQALAKRVIVDQRTDIYSLGATLYELMTLEPAFTGRDRQEVLRQIAFEEPRLPKKINKTIPLELQTIVLKALSKNPADRYTTAREFGDDLERFLNDEPIRAQPPTLRQKVQKWARRHQSVVWMAGAFTIVLTTVVVGGLIAGLMIEARARHEADRARDEAVEEKKRAEEAVAETRAINQFLTRDLLGQASPEENSRDKKITVEDLLDRAAQRINNPPPDSKETDNEDRVNLTNHPLAEASIRLAIGNTYYKLGNYQAAEPHIRRAVEMRQDRLGPDNTDTLTAQEDLVWFLWEALHKPALAEPLSKVTFETRQRVLGPYHWQTLESKDTYTSILLGVGKKDEAVKLKREAYEESKRALGKENKITLTAQSNLGFVLNETGQYAEAAPLMKDCLEIRERISGKGSGEIMATVNNYSVALYYVGKLDMAEKLQRDGYEAIVKTHGREHPHSAHMLNFLARILLDQNKLEEAEKDVREALAIRRTIFKPGDEDIGKTLLLYGRILYAQNRTKEAEDPLREAMALFRERHPDRTELVGEAECWLGACMTARGQYANAEKLLLPGYDKLKGSPMVAGRHKKLAVNHVINLYEAWNKPDEAAQWRIRRDAD
ncbi:MAG: tetratricopeptide repeat protein [Gemmataceae bacterium]